MTPEERAEEKKKQIEAEFNRYKLARRKQELREERERQEGGDEAAEKAEGPADVRSNAEVGSIKERFEQGTAFKSDGQYCLRLVQLTSRNAVSLQNRSNDVQRRR